MFLPLLWLSVGLETDESDALLLSDSAPSETELRRPLLRVDGVPVALKVLPGELDNLPSISSRKP